VREVSREPDIATLRSGSTCDVSYIGYTTEYPGLIPSNQASYRPMSARKRLQDLSRDSAKAETLAKISSRAWSHWFSQSLLCPSPFLLSAISIFYGIDNDAYRRHRQRTGKFPHHRAYSIKLISQATATKSTRPMSSRRQSAEHPSEDVLLHHERSNMETVGSEAVRRHSVAKRYKDNTADVETGLERLDCRRGEDPRDSTAVTSLS
jgi:hypothetical protein